MKFLITGAYGFVGTNLCKYLTKNGHECDALDIPAAKREGVPYSHFYTWEDLQTSQTSNLPTLQPSNHPNLSSYDCVVHLAGKAHDLKKVASEQSYFDINVGLTQRIFNALRQSSVVSGQSSADGAGLTANDQRLTTSPCTFIYFSSSKASPDGNAYGRSKWAAEQWLREKSSVVSGQSLADGVELTTNNQRLTTIILRPAMIHGPGNKGNLNLLWGVAKRGIPWPLAAFENRRSFTSIGNICAAVEALAAQAQSSAVSGQSLADGVGLTTNDIAEPQATQPKAYRLTTFFIADDEMLSTNRLIELIAESCGKRAKLWRIPKELMSFAAKIGDVLHLPLNTERLGKLTEDSFVDNAALKKALGWTKMPLAAEDGMRKTLASFAQQPLTTNH